MLEKNTLRRKSLRIEISAALMTALIVIAVIWSVFNALQEKFIQINVADAGNVNIFIDSELSNAREQLALFALLPDAERHAHTLRRIGTFSDLYELDPNGLVTTVYKSVTGSQVFAGYTFAAGPVWDQLLQNSNVASLSSIVQGYEDGLPSIYVAYRHDNHTILGRLNLNYLRDFINQYSQITGNVLLLTTSTGVVMVSGRPDVSIPRIDIDELGGRPNEALRVDADGQGWIPVVNNSESLEAKLVVLIPTQLLDEQQTLLFLAIGVILLGLTLVILIKSHKLRHDVLIPIGSLIRRIRALEAARPLSEAPPDLDNQPREFVEIHQHFESMANAIQERETALETAATELQARETELRSILDHLPIPLLVFQSRAPFPVTFINSTFTEVFGYTSDEVQNLNGLFSHSCQDAETALVVATQVQDLVVSHPKNGSPGEPIEVSIACRSGVKHDVIIAAISLDTSAIATFVDITPLRTSQRELLKAKTQAEQQEQQKAEFLAMMSHEIRTPLTSIMGITELLQAEPLNQRQRELVQRLSEVDNLLMRIVNDVLDYSKIEAGELSLESSRFNLEELIDKCKRMFAKLAADKGIGLYFNISPDCPAWLMGDGFRIEQVLANLVSNAIKFTDRGEVTITVDCVTGRAPLHGIRVEVKDTGMGIPKDLAGVVFTPFKQTDSTTARRFGGTGLGLSISKRIIEAMGGSIGFKSLPNIGSTFWFELCLPLAEGPIDELTNNSEVATQAYPAHLNNAHILVVEDSQAIQFLVNEMLGAVGVSVSAALDGQQALHVLRDSNIDFDAILMDIQMPNMNGIECTKIIRADPSLREIPIVAMTADLVGGQQQEIIEAGANALLHKPLQKDSLINCLAEHIEKVPWRMFPKIDGIDHDHALQTMSHNPELFKRLVRIFIEENRHIALKTRDDLAHGRSEAAAQRLHSLRGSASQLGALQLRDIAQQIEELILQDKRLPVHLIDSLDMQLAKIQASVESTLDA